MKLDKIITVVVLALSFCVFDQMKDRLAEKVNSQKVTHETFAGSLNKINDLMPGDFVRAEVICGESGDCEKDNGLISVDLGEKIYKAILLLEF